MAHTPSSSPKPDPPIEFYKIKWIWWGAALLILAILLCSWIVSCRSSSNAEPAKPKPAAPVEKPMEPPEKSVMIVKKVQLDPVKWSEWISVVQLKPPEVPYDAEVEYKVNAPKWHEYLFIDGQQVKVTEDDEPIVYLNLTKNTFKLRGEGEAIVRVQYFFH